MSRTMEQPQTTSSRAEPDPLRPSARRVVLLIAGAVLCVMTFGIGVWIGLLPLGYWSSKRESLIARAERGDPTLDFASAEWSVVNYPAGADLPHLDFIVYAGEGLPLLIMALLVPLIAVVGHILIARFAALLALRTDRRLDLGLGPRPARALAAALTVRVLYRNMLPWSLVSGVVGGLFLLGLFQYQQLRPLGFEWIPYVGILACVLALIPLDAWSTVGSARERLRLIAPLESRICNGCGYSLRGLRGDAAACPECGRALLDNRTFVSLILGRRAGRAVKWAAFVVLVLVATTAVLGLLMSPTARTVAADWVLARPPVFAPWHQGQVIAPAVSVVRISDGTTIAYLSARTSGLNERTRVRARVIKLNPPAEPQRRESFAASPSRPIAPIGAGPVQVFNSWQHGRSGAGFHLFANGGMPPAAISIRFASTDELSAADWAWLTETLEPDAESGK